MKLKANVTSNISPAINLVSSGSTSVPGSGYRSYERTRKWVSVVRVYHEVGIGRRGALSKPAIEGIIVIDNEPRNTLRKSRKLSTSNFEEPPSIE